MELFSIIVGIVVGLIVSAIFSACDEKSKLGKVIANLEKLFNHYVEQQTKVTHDWSKWEEFDKGELGPSNGGSTGRFIYLRRTCGITGEQEIKKVTS